MARDAQADGRADHPDLISIPRSTIELDPYADRRYLRGCAKTEVALRDELSLNLRPRPAEFAAADRLHAKGSGPAVPMALDPVRGRSGRWVLPSLNHLPRPALGVSQ
jgi:hypothetical protein